jgi:hypothetical protein
MTADFVDTTLANERISRAIRAAMAARGVKDAKHLAALSGIQYDTLLRRMDGKPWLASEILAVATALDVEAGALLETDPEQWFRRSSAGAPPLRVIPPTPLRAEILRSKPRSVRDTPSYVSDYARLNRTALPGARVGAIDSAAA